MSRENLESLLDAMLDESEINRAAEAEREREMKAARAAQHAPPAPRALEDVEALTGLPEGDLRKVLAKAAPDDLLVLLATAGDVLQRRILGNLSAESVAWLRANLAHIDEVSNAEREGAHANVLKAANALLGAGEIGAPEAESVGADAAPNEGDKDLRELLTDLVRIAKQAGPAALTQLLSGTGEPLLVDGLALIGEGREGDALRSSLALRRAELEASYARRLAWIEEALVAIAAGEAADAFRARIFDAPR